MSFWKLLAAICGLLTIAAIVSGLIGIWSGDPRWSDTGGVFAIAAVSIGFVAFFTALVAEFE